MLLQWFQWLHDLPVSLIVRESFWVFPLLECIHIYSMIFLFTMVAAFDMRLVGIKIGHHQQRPSDLDRKSTRLNSSHRL